MKRIALIAVLLFLVVVNTAFEETTNGSTRRANFRSGPTGSIYVVVDKSDYELRVYDEEGWYATYPVVFGNKDLGDKMMEGDRKTPEGHFRVISKKPHQKWHKMLMLDYPNQDSWAKFNQRKAAGKIPRTAKIGGGIAIHGTWPNDNLSVDDFTNWTNGCVSLKNEDLDELDAYLPVGTRVTIQR